MSVNMLQVISNDTVPMKFLTLWGHKQNNVARYFFDIDDGDVSFGGIPTEWRALPPPRCSASADGHAVRDREKT